MGDVPRTYLPAAGHDWLLPLYDPFVRLLGGERATRSLIDRAALEPGHRVLDIGCGTGTLAVTVRRGHPEVDVVGLDPDPRALARARRKAERAGVSVRFDRGFSDELPYPAASFDRVFSSFMFHHLGPDEKARTLGEVRRVLKPGGFLLLLDFVGPADGRGSLLGRLLHVSQHLQDNDEARVLRLMRDAGFADARTVGRERVMFLTAACYQASVTAPNAATA